MPGEGAQHEADLADILVRLIDPPVQWSHEPEDKKLRVMSQLGQLPWALETALVKYLHNIDPELFEQPPREKYPDRSYLDAGPRSSSGQPYYAGPSHLLQYVLSDRFCALAHLAPTEPVTCAAPKAVEEWLKEHGLYRTDDDNPDPHFAERAFVVNVLVPAFGTDVLRHVETQKTYPALQYVVDFCVHTASGEVLVEIDGAEYHAPSRIGAEAHERQLERQNALQRLGKRLFRYTARQVLQDPEATIRKVREDIRLPRQGALGLPVGDAPATDPVQEHVQYAMSLCRWFRPFELGFLLSLCKARGSPAFTILDVSSPPGLIYMALRDLGYLIGRAQALYGTSARWPQTVVAQGMKPAPRALTAGYELVCESGPDQLKEALPFELIVSEARDESSPANLVVDLRREGRIPLVPEGGVPDVLGFEAMSLATMRARFSTLALPRPGPRNGLRPMDLSKRLLDYFARRFLRIPCLYHRYDPERSKVEERQYELIERVMRLKPVFGIMRTGRGKSAAFQLPAKLLPGGALVISPLRALMRDQTHDLRWIRGFNAVEAMLSDEKKGNRLDRALKDFLAGYTDLLYLSPERLQMVKFSEEVTRQVANVRVAFVAVDEAHCVSEWGHDFRLSYMHIRSFVKDLARFQGLARMPILALTATASPPVMRDVCAILGLDERDVRGGGDLLLEQNIDRPELSLSVHLIEGSNYPEDRQRALAEVLRGVLPHALRHNHSFDWERFCARALDQPAAGVVFCIYRSPHGQGNWQDGIGAVRDFLVSAAIAPPTAVRMYGSDAPNHCPACAEEGRFTYGIRQLTKSEGKGYECAQGHRFPQPIRSARRHWQKLLNETQIAFKQNAFPLLVSTKAYGMGIDHRGLRFIVHYGLPSSIESYYQEMSRAGRDGKQAHCALLVRVPSEHCRQLCMGKGRAGAHGFLDDEPVFPPCLVGANRRTSLCAPAIGLPEPCDLARQLRLTLDTYLEPNTFASQAAELWARLLRRAVRGGAATEKVRGGDPNAERVVGKTHNQLYRLRQLGLVSDYNLEYKSRGQHFDVVFHAWLSDSMTGAELQRHLTSKMVDIGATHVHRQDQARMSRLRAEAERIVKNALPSLFPAQLNRGTVETAVRLLFGAVRAHVLNMRVESFQKLLDYIACDRRGAEECRRGPLLRGMTGESYLRSGHRCGFCDVCVPGMQVQQERATVPEDAQQDVDLMAALKSTFLTGDFDELDRVVREAANRAMLDTVGSLATTETESDPDNPAANLAAAISYSRHRDPLRRVSAHRYHHRFASFANVREREQTLANRGYSAYRDFDREKAIREYAAVDSAFDQRAGIQRLDADAQGTHLDAAEQAHLKTAFLEAVNREVVSAMRPLRDALDDFLA